MPEKFPLPDYANEAERSEVVTDVVKLRLIDGDGKMPAIVDSDEYNLYGLKAPKMEGQQLNATDVETAMKKLGYEREGEGLTENFSVKYVRKT